MANVSIDDWADEIAGSRQLQQIEARIADEIANYEPEIRDPRDEEEDELRLQERDRYDPRYGG